MQKKLQKEHLVEQLQRQCQQEKETREILQQQVEKLSSEVLDAMTYKDKWQVAADKIKELEVELQTVHLQLLQQVSSSQESTSELREEFELALKHLLHEPSSDRVEFLRGRQDMVNHIIQISRKSREAQLAVEKLQDAGKQLTEDVTKIVKKLGDPEEQEIINGALKALELENQVLKVRNSQLEEAFKGHSLPTTWGNSNNVEENCNDNMILKNNSEHIPKVQSEWVEEKQIMESNAAVLYEKIEKLEKKLSVLEKVKCSTDAELEAMTAVVQDLEMQLSASKEETAVVTTSLEELDLQHQDAIDQLLVVKKSLQEDKEQLLHELRMAKQEADVTTESQTDEVLESLLHEKVTKLLTFEISEELLSGRMKIEGGEGSQLVGALVKMCAECKWQRDTLERKVACLMKELRECCEERDTLAELSQGSSSGLPSIPENSEEVEVLTQKVLALEENAAVLTESRSNLEADAERLREETNRLANMLQASEESLRNERNLNTEATVKLNTQILSLQEEVKSVHAKFLSADQERLLLEASFSDIKDKLNHEVQINAEVKLMLQESNTRNLNLQQEFDQISAKISAEVLCEIDSLRQDYADLQNKYSENVSTLCELESFKSDVELESQSLKEQLSNVLQQLEDKNSVCLDLKSLLHEKDNAIEVLKVSLNESQMESREIRNCLKTLESSCKAVENELQEVLGQKTTIEGELKETHDKIVEQEKLLVILQDNVTGKDLQLEELMGVVAQLEVKCSQKQQEIMEWKERSLARQRQLEETLTAKTTLEEDCKRLLELERSVHDQELLQKEVTSLSNELDSTKHELHQSQECSGILELRVQELQQQFIDHSDNILRLNKAITVANEHLEAEKLLSLQLEAECSQHQQMLDQANVEAAKWRQSYEVAIAELDKSKEVAQNIRTDTKALAGTHCKAELQQKETTKEQMQNVGTDSNITLEKCDGGKLVASEEPVAAPDVSKIHSEVECVIKNLDVGEDASHLLRKKLFEVFSIKNNSELLLEAGHREMDALKVKLLELEQENTALTTHHQFQSKETSHMAKETIARLSELIKEKDLEIEALARKNESLVSSLENAGVDGNVKTDALMRLQGERDELIKAVRQKHEENLHYHAEIQRLNVLLNQELRRSEESRQQQKGLELQFEDKQKTLRNTQNELISVKQRLEKLEALAQNSEPFQTTADIQKTVANLESELAKKDDVIKRNCEMLMSCESVIQRKDQELGQLLSQISHLQAQVEIASLQEHTSAKNTKVGELENELTSVSDALQEERTHRKYLVQEIQELKEKKSALQKELERLRLHLVGVEEHYTEEALKTEALVKDLKQQILNAEERIKNSSTAYTSVSIRANQQVETLQEQVRLISQQRDDIQQKLSSAEDQMEKQAAALFNLQAVLKQFHRDKEREIMSETDRLRQQLQASLAKETEISAEIKMLKGQLLEAKEGLSAAAGLGEELDRKTNLVAAMKEEISKLKEHASEAEARIQKASHSSDGKVDRSLVKNLVLGYFLAPSNRRVEVLRVVATVLDFSEEERTRAGVPEGTGPGKSGWLQGLLHPGGELHQTPSLSEAFIKFLENESQPQLQLRLLPERKISQGSETGRADGSVAQSRPAPLLLHDMQLPSFSQFPISRNSSSILKDVLKDS